MMCWLWHVMQRTKGCPDGLIPRVRRASRNQRRPTVVVEELRVATARNNGESVLNPDQSLTLADDGARSNRMIVGVIVAAEQCWDRLTAISWARQQADSLLEGLPNHHARRSEVAVVATQAHENANHFAASDPNIGGEDVDVASAIPKGDGLTVERNGTWTPRSKRDLVGLRARRGGR